MLRRTVKVSRHYKILVVLILSLLSVITQENFAKEIAPLEHEQIIKIVSEKGAPLNYYAEDGTTIEGYAFELIKAIMENADLKYEISIKPWARAYREVSEQKNMLIYSLGRTIEREDRFVWLGKIITVKNNIYRLRQKKPETKKVLAEFKDYRIGVSKNSLNYEYLLKNNFEKLVHLNSYPQTFELLSRKRLDYFTSSVIGILQFIKDNQIDPNIIEPVMNIQNFNPVLYFAANIDSDKQLIEKIRHSYQQLVNDGTYDKIMGSLLEEQKRMRLSLE